MIELPTTVFTDGVEQHLYAVEFESDGKVFHTYIYAVDKGHAVMIVQDMKVSLKVDNRILSAYKP